jgi:hypothetical protein
VIPPGGFGVIAEGHEAGGMLTEGERQRKVEDISGWLSGTISATGCSRTPQ